MRLKNSSQWLGRLKPRKKRPENRSCRNAQLSRFDGWSVSAMTILRKITMFPSDNRPRSRYGVRS
jgi:hypothetical protein